MPKTKSLVDKVSEKFSRLKEKYSPRVNNAVFDAKIRLAYLQESLKDIVPKANKENIGKLALISLTAPAVAITYSISALASETINVKEYIKDKFSSSMFSIYLESLGELDKFEKEFIDLLSKPEQPKDVQMDYAKEVYHNGFTQELLEKLKEDKTLTGKPILKGVKKVDESILGLEKKVNKKPENSVDTYAVIANGTDEKIFGGSLISALTFYQLLKDIRVSDDNINLLLYQPNHKNFKDAERYITMKKSGAYSSVSVILPSYQKDIVIDEDKVTLKKFLEAISHIPSDDNDFVYIFYSSNEIKDGKVKFPGGYLDSKDLVKATKNIDYGKLIIWQDSPYAATSLKDLEGITNYLAIASCGEEKEIIMGGVPSSLVKYFRREPSDSISKLIDKVNKEFSRFFYNPEMVIFYSDKNFCNEPLIPKSYLLE